MNHKPGAYSTKSLANVLGLQKDSYPCLEQGGVYATKLFVCTESLFIYSPSRPFVGSWGMCCVRTLMKPVKETTLHIKNILYYYVSTTTL